MTTDWIGQVVMFTTATGIVPAITTAHYLSGIQSDIAAEDADTVDLVTLANNSSKFVNVPRIDPPSFADRLTLEPKSYFVGEAGILNGDGSVTQIVSMTQFEYDALTEVDETTLYILTE